MRSRVRFPALPCAFFLERGRSPWWPLSGYLVEIRYKAPPGTTDSSFISPSFSSGQRNRAYWASQLQLGTSSRPVVPYKHTTGSKIPLPNTDQAHDKHLWTTTNNFSQVQLYIPWWWVAYDSKHVGVIFNFVSFKLLCGPGSSVGIATAHGLDGPGIEPRWGEIFRTSPDQPWDPHSLLYSGYRVFPGGKMRPGRDADPSPPSSAEV